jgi:hypothetical protein
MVLRPGFQVVAVKLQEAADALSNSDVVNRLRDAISDAFRGTPNYGYYIDHFGDAESGDVIYSCNSDTRKAPYEINSATGAAVCTIDMEAGVDVVPRTVYEEEAEEEDHYAAMGESFKTANLYNGLPLYERFISKSERDSADSSDFAGKGKSYPILKPEDVTAAAASIGRAGSGNLGPSGLKARIIAIAKRKGWGKNLPKAWQSDTKEAKKPASKGLQLVESATSTEAIVLREAKADYEIKLIAPGKGSSAFYPAEVLRRDGPNVFKAGTHVYLNHATAVEEAQRPEGDVRNLAGVLTTNAEYIESHAKGPGLYGRMKVFADHAQLVEEKAPHVGMSIRASGVAESNKTKMGVPVLKELTSAESVDVVTRAGAGGMILTESAAPAAIQQEVSEMDPEITKLQETVAAQALVNKQLLERALRSDAREEAGRLLEAITLPSQAKARVIARVLESAPPLKDGALDTTKLKEAVDAAAKAEGEYLASIIPSGNVIGMGQRPQPQLDATEAARQDKLAKDEEENAVNVFESLGLPKNAAGFAAKGRAA